MSAMLMLGILAALFAAGVPVAGAAPVPEIARAVAQKSPTNAEPLRLSVTFSEPVLGLLAEDVVLSESAAVAVREVVPYDGTTYEIEIRGVSGDGSVCASIPAGAATGLDGELCLASTGIDPCVILDRTPPPPPELLGPNDGAATPDLSPRFAWTAPVDESGIAKYEVEIRGPKTRDYVTSNTSYTPVLGVEGCYTWRVSCLDRAGTWGPWTPWRSLILDKSPPEAPAVVSSSPNAGPWSQVTAVDLAVAPGTDLIAGVEGHVVVWDKSSSTVPTGTSNRGSAWILETLAEPADGEWWCHAVAVDRAGNCSAPCHAGPFRIDRTPPVLVGLTEDLTLPNDPGFPFATVDWSAVTVADALDPSPSVSFSIPDGARLPLGCADVVVTVRDHAGNVLARTLHVWVENTEPPVVAILYPEDEARVVVGELLRPSWNVHSLAPIEATRTQGLVDGLLDTQIPGRHEFSVTVADATGLCSTASASYVVAYAERNLEIARVRADGTEELVWVSQLDSAKDAQVTFSSSETVRVRCQVELPPRVARRELPITFSLLRASRSKTAPPVIERVGILESRGTLYSADVALAELRSGVYTLWIGFVDESNESLQFRLIR